MRLLYLVRLFTVRGIRAIVTVLLIKECLFSHFSHYISITLYICYSTLQCSWSPSNNLYPSAHVGDFSLGSEQIASVGDRREGFGQIYLFAFSFLAQSRI